MELHKAWIKTEAGPLWARSTAEANLAPLLCSITHPTTFLWCRLHRSWRNQHRTVNTIKHCVLWHGRPIFPILDNVLQQSTHCLSQQMIPISTRCPITEKENIRINKTQQLDYINSPAHCCITQPPVAPSGDSASHSINYVAPSGDCERVIL